MIDHLYYVIPGRIGPNLCKFVKSVVPFLSRNKSISKSLPCGPNPQNMARPLIGPPTLERSGSEHWRAVTSSLFGQETGLVRDMESSLEGGTRWFEEFHSHKPHLLASKMTLGS